MKRFSERKQAVRPPRYAPTPLLPRGRRRAFRRRADGNVAAVSHGQHVLTPAPLPPPDALARRWAKRPGDLDVWPFDLESGVEWRGHLCTNFGLPRPVLDLGPMYATDRRQKDRRQTKASLNAPPIRGAGRGHNNTGCLWLKHWRYKLLTNLLSVVQACMASMSFLFVSNWSFCKIENQ